MKPLDEIKGITGSKELSDYEHRGVLIDLARMRNCLVKLEDGSLLNVSLTMQDSNEIVEIQTMKPYYEFIDEDEVRMFIQTDNEVFENYMRYRKLKKLLED